MVGVNMSKRESIVFQTSEILKNAYHDGFGRSRHADKENAKKNGKRADEYTKNIVYSQGTYKATNKICIAFVKHCREEYGIKYLKEIKPEMFQSFIKKGDFKTGAPYDPKTAGTYASEVTKLQNVYNSKNGTKLAFVDKGYKKYVGNKEFKKIQMPRMVHDKIIQKAYETKSTNGMALDIARSLGLRVTEITNLRKEDFKFKNGKLKEIHIHRSKGGRSRDIKASMLTKEQIEKVEMIYGTLGSQLSDHDRLFTNKSQSYEKAFTRARDAVTNGEYTYCGIHSMRKEFAKDYFNREMGKGRNELEVKRELTQLLGHNRIEVLKSYLD